MFPPKVRNVGKIRQFTKIYMISIQIVEKLELIENSFNYSTFFLDNKKSMKNSQPKIRTLTFPPKLRNVSQIRQFIKIYMISIQIVEKLEPIENSFNHSTCFLDNKKFMKNSQVKIRTLTFPPKVRNVSQIRQFTKIYMISIQIVEKFEPIENSFNHSTCF